MIGAHIDLSDGNWNMHELQRGTTTKLIGWAVRHGFHGTWTTPRQDFCDRANPSTTLDDVALHSKHLAHLRAARP